MFPNATRVTDRFHKIKIASKAPGLNTAGKPLIRKMKLESQENKKKFEPYVLTNGDTLSNYSPEVISYKKQIKVV
jgi:hypothetical protein